MIRAEAVLALLGQRAGKLESPEQSARTAVRRGLPASALDRLADALNVPLAQLQGVLGIPRATAARRRAAGATLKPIVSDRAFRIARILALAAAVLESNEKAAAWLRTSNRALEGEIPLAMLDTEIGARNVEALLTQIEYGVYS